MVNNEPNPTLKDQISGRSVLIGEGKDLVFGIQVDVPITNAVRAYLKEHFNIEIPLTIKSFSLFDLTPDDSLETKDKVFLPSPGSTRPQNSDLVKLVEQELKLTEDGKSNFELKSKELGAYPIHTFFEELNLNEVNKKILNETLNKTDKSSIAIVSAHGSQKNWSMGEEEDFQPINDKGEPIQSRGNSIEVQKFVDILNDKYNFASAFLYVCNPEKSEITTNKTPIFYSKGNVGPLIKTPLTQSVVALPKSQR